MYMWFVVKQLDPDSGRGQGLFQAGGRLWRSGILTKTDSERLTAIEVWFSKNLRRPSRLAISTKPHRKAQAISWLKISAHEHINKMREFQQILERNGLGVELLRTAQPGYIVYEDEFQVAAYPFNDTPT